MLSEDLTPSRRLLRRNGPQGLRLEEPARNGRQDDRRESDHGGKDRMERFRDRPLVWWQRPMSSSRFPSTVPT